MLLLSSVLFGCGEEETTTEFTNLPPFSPIVDLQPSVPYTNDDLEAIIISNSIDPDGQDVTLTYLWYKNDELQPDLTATTVPSDLTDRGDIWTVAVISSDGTLSSADTRRSVTIRNSIPAVDASATMLMWVDDNGDQIADSEAPMVDDVLSEHAGENIKVVTQANDIDVTDEITFTYEWEVDGVVTDVTEDTLPASQLSRGQDWIVRVIPNDGLTDGEAYEVPFGFYNAVPVIEETSIVVLPQDPVVGDVMTCEALATDEEGDEVTLTYSWTVTVTGEGDDEDQVTEVAGDSLDTISSTSGSVITCSVVASDGLDTSESVVSDEVTLGGNTLPVVTSVSITPEAPVVGDVLSCEATATDYENGELDASSITYAWFADGTSETPEADGTLDTTGMAVDTVVTCEATANDGESDSLVVEAEVTLTEESSD